MKVIYFTSTGNSLWVARKFTDNPLSIVQLLRDVNYEINEDEAIGIIVPDHVCDIPEPVREYLKKASLTAPYKAPSHKKYNRPRWRLAPYLYNF